MGDKGQFRSEEARRNYEKQEKQRLRAAKRKEYNAKKAALTEKAGAWFKANRKQVTIGVAALAAVILLAGLVSNFFAGPGGSLPVIGGKVRGMQESWVVADLNPRSNGNAGSSNVDRAPRSKTPRYFRLAELAPLSGFTQQENRNAGDKNVQNQHYIAEEKGGLVESVYVFGIANKTAAKHTGDMVSVMSLSEVTSEIKTAAIAGHDVQYVYFLYNGEADAAGEVTTAYASLCLCIDTTQDACVLVLLNTPNVAKEDVPPADVLLAEAEAVLRNLTVY